MRFLEDHSSTFTKKSELDEGELEAKGNLFVWAIVITVLLGLNIGSWVFCSLVFGHPEHPVSYRLLTRMEKLEPLKGYRSTTVPSGEFHSAKDLYSITFPFSASQIRAYNGMLKRHYLWNYRDRFPATFVFGTFVIKEVRPLNQEDLFTRGILVRAAADRFPDVEVELVLPTLEEIETADQFVVGEVFEIGKSNMAASVLHARRLKHDAISFLAVPLFTRENEKKTRDFPTPSGEVLVLQTPQKLNIQRMD